MCLSIANMQSLHYSILTLHFMCYIDYSPLMSEPHHAVPPVNLEITVRFNQSSTMCIVLIHV